MTSHDSPAEAIADILVGMRDVVHEVFQELMEQAGDPPFLLCQRPLENVQPAETQQNIRLTTMKE